MAKGFDCSEKGWQYNWLLNLIDRWTSPYFGFSLVKDETVDLSQCLRCAAELGRVPFEVAEYYLKGPFQHCDCCQLLDNDTGRGRSKSKHLEDYRTEMVVYEGYKSKGKKTEGNGSESDDFEGDESRKNQIEWYESEEDDSKEVNSKMHTLITHRSEEVRDQRTNHSEPRAHRTESHDSSRTREFQRPISRDRNELHPEQL